MGNIVLLDELTINKIAAGEVIERPASVIKEMVENSIDAGATTITVEIKNGGISYIRIVDNGKGIASDDLEMAFERHATSKIRSADDLETVRSMGFRGEALASIAAVANVELVSKTANEPIGHRIVVEGGNVLNKEEAACGDGTIITVQNLFFNTPVRYKFLKKDFTESGYIEDVITQIALVHPEISFKFINTGKTILQTTGNGDIASVIYSIYGKEVADAIIKTEYKYEDITVRGVIGKPEIARSNRSRQLFFVNKRFVKDKTLSAAVAEAFKGMIPLGKFGFVILNVEMDPGKVDVNVHPAKLEVRFEEENKVFKAVYHTIKDALLKSELVANTSKEKNTNDLFGEQKEDKHEKDRSGGLFGWKKNKKESIDDAIERVGERDNIISQIYNDKIVNKKSNFDFDKMDFPKVSTNTVNTGFSKPFQNDTEKESVPKAFQSNIGKIDTKPSTVAAGEPVDTSNILEQLKQLQEKMKRDAEEAKREIKNLARGEKTEDYSLDTSTENDSKVEEETEKYNVNTENNMSEGNTDLAKGLETENLNNEENIEEKSNIENNETQGFTISEETEEILKQNKELKEEYDNVKSKIDEMLDNNDQELSTDFTEMYLKTFGILPPTESNNKEVAEKDDANSALDVISDESNMSLFEESEENTKPSYRFIGIAFKTYIILEMNNELYLFDQHAAHERILYEKVKSNYYSGEIDSNSQLMLLPDVITLTHKEMDIAKDNMEMFEKAGFVLEEFGENTIKLSGVPDICLDLDTKELFLETLDEINAVARTAKQEIEERFIATVACKAAVKAGMDLTEEEVDKLMNQLLQLPNPFTCPHGRPIAIKMTKYDLERKFSRK